MDKFCKKTPLHITEVLVDGPYNWKNWASEGFCRVFFHGEHMSIIDWCVPLHFALVRTLYYKHTGVFYYILHRPIHYMINAPMHFQKCAPNVVLYYRCVILIERPGTCTKFKCIGMHNKINVLVLIVYLKHQSVSFISSTAQ